MHRRKSSPFTRRVWRRVAKAENGIQVTGGASMMIMKSENEGATITVTPNGSHSQVTVIYGDK